MGKAERIPTDYKQIDGLEYIDHEDLYFIESSASGMELEQCLTALMIDKSDLSDRETDVVKKVWARGRELGIKTAFTCLFDSMKGKSGTPASVEYLKQFASTFSAETVPTPGSSSGFSFNVNLNGEPANDSKE